MDRQQTTKELAQRIEPGYIRRYSGPRWVRGLLSLLFIALPLVWWWRGGSERRDAMINPGHVSAAHALWENKCSVCHDNDSKGGFRKAVSDSACLTCHSAAAHHPNQLLRTGGNAHNDLALAIDDSKRGLRSADCIVCHVEHRGHKSLAAVNDATCTKCHANINSAVLKETNGSNVKAFNAAGGHPYFGREWTAGGTLPHPAAPLDSKVLADPTHLKFNHARHMQADADPTHGAMADNCSSCHQNQDRGPLADQSIADASPVSASIRFSTGGNAGGDVHRRVEPWTKGDMRYMRPISYERDCKLCHPLKIAGGAVLPHVRFDLVQSQLAPVQGATTVAGQAAPVPVKLAHVEDFYRTWLARASAADKARVLADQPAEKWVKDSATQLQTSLTEWASGVKAGSMPGAEGLEADIIKLPDEVKIDPDAAGKDIRLISGYIAYGMGSSSCVKCHAVKQLNRPVEAKAASAPATAPDEKPAETALPEIPLLVTVATGIPDSPRRWFVHSMFDHQAHQNMTCIECHAGAKQSTLTTDVLSPNLTWTEIGGRARSCAECHRPPNATSRGVAANCVSCHTFHDRTGPSAALAAVSSRQVSSDKPHP